MCSAQGTPEANGKKEEASEEVEDTAAPAPEHEEGELVEEPKAKNPKLEEARAAERELRVRCPSLKAGT